MEALLLGSRVIKFNFVPSRIQRIKLIKGTVVTLKIPCTVRKVIKIFNLNKIKLNQLFY